MHDAYHTARGRSFDIAREELPLLVRISDTIVLSYCSGGYWLCNYTMPRWRRYTAFHGYDHAVISNDNMDAISHHFGPGTKIAMYCLRLATRA
jgi:hypothetical protein